MATSLPKPEDKIAAALELQPIPSTSDKLAVDHSQIEDDYDYARGNMIALIEKGQEALTGILDVAGMNQQPRSYEVVATLIKSVSDANKDLMELAKRKKDLTKEDPKHPSTVNNNLFVGNAAELLKMLKDNKDGV